MSGSAISPGGGRRRRARYQPPAPWRAADGEPVPSRVGSGVLAAVRLFAIWGVSLVGAAALLAAPGLLLVAVNQPWHPPTVAEAGGGGEDRYHLWLLVVLTLIPCAVLGARRLVRSGVGQEGKAALGAGEAVLLVPPVLALAALAVHHGPLPGGNHGVVWLSLPLFACGVLGMRGVAGVHRRVASSWSRTPITVPYRAAPAPATGTRPWWGRWWPWTRWVLTDPATWRDLLWTSFTGGVGATLAALVATPVCAVTRLFGAFLGPGPVGRKPAEAHVFLAAVTVTATLLMMLPIVLWAAPRLMLGYSRSARCLLGPSRQEELAQRVDHLAQTRSDTLDAGAAEMRRIERDLHDGAQARLVAMGMALDTAQHLVVSNPEAARSLLVEVKASSVKALAELRDLVRGIHPPVLADRGLADGVHALALDLPHRVYFSGELAGRAPAPVESAAYFAVSELLANVTKHAEARQIWIEIGHDSDLEAGTLRITITDDGRGGADPADGTGLLGVERRLAAFDGVLAISSPPGGPTIVNMEIPCALSSPKTSSS
ncbi:histidine kinase [Streptomyces sp. RY43-2]|uniref:histidine kinase n=1 Tax=Streptomyces macrolidinus TaxID=2952607 RepID=A0ABT0ZI17_9ACTN|nr:histidine kinase [Streptomyces macrolidinus]MCN9243205.1 histidine kinase [Streptomyces macrolidinus]